MEPLSRSLSERRMIVVAQLQIRQKRRELPKLRLAETPDGPASPASSSSPDSEESHQLSILQLARHDPNPPLPNRLSTSPRVQRKLKLRSSDGVIVEVEDKFEDGTFRLPFLTSLAGYNTISRSSVQTIPVPRVPGDILKRVVNYCRLAIDNQFEGAVRVQFDVRNSEEDYGNQPLHWQPAAANLERSVSFADSPSPWLEPWQENYAELNRDHLLQLLDAAHHLHIKDLLNLITKAIGKRIAWMSREELKVYFGLQNEVSADEYRMIREAFPSPAQDYSIPSSPATPPTSAEKPRFSRVTL